MKMKMTYKPIPVDLKIAFKSYHELQDFTSTMGFVADYVGEQIRKGQLDDTLGSHEKKAIMKDLLNFNKAVNDAWELPDICE